MDLFDRSRGRLREIYEKLGCDEDAKDRFSLALRSTISVEVDVLKSPGSFGFDPEKYLAVKLSDLNREFLYSFEQLMAKKFDRHYISIKIKPDSCFKEIRAELVIEFKPKNGANGFEMSIKLEPDMDNTDEKTAKFNIFKFKEPMYASITWGTGPQTLYDMEYMDQFVVESATAVAEKHAFHGPVEAHLDKRNFVVGDEVRVVHENNKFGRVVTMSGGLVTLNCGGRALKYRIEDLIKAD